MLVLKIGGSIMDYNLSHFFDELALRSKKEDIILVHGGGRVVDKVAKQSGIEQKYITSPSGIRSRYTDIETLNILIMVIAGRINKFIVAELMKRDVNAVGLSGADGRLIFAKRKVKLRIKEGNKILAIDGGYTGKIIDVNKNFLTLLLEHKYLPVVSPIGIDSEGNLLNLDGDRVATYIAAYMGADDVILFTDVPGVLINGKLVEKISTSKLGMLKPQLGPGMERKLLYADEALKRGVSRVHIAPIDMSNPISSALNCKSGTLVIS
ncbi:MAG: [LysW]-aminoadipate/[LysW]-glutamate kinase [Candidatus Asgardarchaeia archaeon]